MPKLIKLDTWAREQYGDDAPSSATLRRWANSGRLFPAPELHGKCWYVRPETRYAANTGGSIIDRMRSVYGTASAQA